MGAPLTTATATLRIQTLGGLRAWHGDEPLALPPSRQARALLAYLACANRPQVRSSLCDLLWGETPDPRAALRWSMSRLRPVLDSGGVARLATEGETVWILPEALEVDGKRLRDLAAGAGSAEADELEASVTRLSGPFLADLEFADAFRFENWRLAEEKSLAQARASVFAELLRRHDAAPEAQVRVAHLWAQQDPLDSRPHASIIAALSSLGRKREALAHYERCVNMLRGQGGGADAALENARAGIGRIGGAGTGPIAAKPFSSRSPLGAPGLEAGAVARPPLVGRGPELERFAGLIAGRETGRLHLLCGEPGIGKTRLLEEMSARLGAKGWLRLRGRAFEAERGRAFGPWIDAAAALPEGAGCPLLRHGDAPESARTDPDSVHMAMRDWLARAAGGKPLALLFDDVHWLDTASVGLLHYLLRDRERVFAIAVAGMRSVAAPANGPLEALLTYLRREGAVSQWDIGPLDAAGVAELLRTIGSERDPADVFARGEGHPLSSLALALEGAGDDRGSRASLEAMLDERIRLAGDDGRAILQWAALIGRGMPPALLETLLDLSVHDLLNRLDGLESQGLVRIEEGKGGMEYLFGHDLIRQRVRAGISEPRRARMHAHAAQVLRDNLSLARGWEEVATHAEAGGVGRLASEAFLESAQHCSRLFAFESAEALVRRGLEAAEGANQWAHIQGLCVLANNIGSSLGRFPEGFDARLKSLIAKAKAARHDEAMVMLMGCLASMRYIKDQPEGVNEAIREAEKAGEAITDPRLKAYSLADAATCLYATDQEISRARLLVLESVRLAKEIDYHDGIILAGQAMLAQREGRLDDARDFLRRGSEILLGKDMQMVEGYNFHMWAQVEIEAGNPVEALALVAKCREYGEWVKQKADFHFADAFEAMARRMLGEPAAEPLFRATLETLRTFNCKVMTSYLILWWSEQDLDAGEYAGIEARCREAIERCEPLGRMWEPSWARVLMGLAASRQGRHAEARAHLESLGKAIANPAGLPAHVLRRLEELDLALSQPA